MPDTLKSAVRASLTARNIGLSIDGRVLLDDVSVTVEPGKVVALVGRNGSGKSTLLKVIARQVANDRGSVELDGDPAHRTGHRDFARRVGYLQQHLPPTDGMSVAELVACGRYPWHGATGRFGAEDAAKVVEAMALTGVDTYRDRAVDTLSGGERQRAWIAMMLAQDARWLLMDEPISALDIQHQMEVLTLVRKLSRERGNGVLAVLHDVNLAARFADRVVALRDGRVRFEGTPDELMQPSCLHAIFGIEMTVLAGPDGCPPVAHAL
jgi:ferric hydroxamate transport system ATP-binding protein